MTAVAEGVDFANQRPSGAALRAAGKRFVVRYLSPNTTNNPRKQLTAAEVSEYHGAGLAICVVWETGTSRARAGHAAGQADADAAVVRLKALGGPATLPIYFAIDEDTTGPAVVDYFRGVASRIGVARTGAYGGIRPISYLFDNGLIRYGWQTYAWSGGRWDPCAQAQQYRNNVSVPGVGSGYDLDRATTGDYGQWNPDGTFGDQGVMDVEPIDVWDFRPNPPWPGAADETAFGQLAEARNNAIAAVQAVAALAGKVDLVAGKLDALSTKIDGLSGATPGTGVSAATLAAAERAAADVLDPQAAN